MPTESKLDGTTGPDRLRNLVSTAGGRSCSERHPRRDSAIGPSGRASQRHPLTMLESSTTLMSGHVNVGSGEVTAGQWFQW